MMDPAPEVGALVCAAAAAIVALEVAAVEATELDAPDLTTEEAADAAEATVVDAAESALLLAAEAAAVADAEAEATTAEPKTEEGDLLLSDVFLTLVLVLVFVFCVVLFALLVLDLDLVLDDLPEVAAAAAPMMAVSAGIAPVYVPVTLAVEVTAPSIVRSVTAVPEGPPVPAMMLTLSV